ncbi:MAG: hypothetical protein AB7U75_14800 [Hyphomicrobiaceae bacterium]
MTEVFKEVPQDWYGNFRIANDARYEGKRFVSVKCGKLPLGRDWRVSVWGNDDFGMEYDVELEGVARSIFNTVVNTPDLTQEKLEAIGFVRA